MTRKHLSLILYQRPQQHQANPSSLGIHPKDFLLPLASRFYLHMTHFQFGLGVLPSIPFPSFWILQPENVLGRPLLFSANLCCSGWHLLLWHSLRALCLFCFLQLQSKGPLFPHRLSSLERTLLLVVRGIESRMRTGMSFGWKGLQCDFLQASDSQRRWATHSKRAFLCRPVMSLDWISLPRLSISAVSVGRLGYFVINQWPSSQPPELPLSLFTKQQDILTGLDRQDARIKTSLLVFPPSLISPWIRGRQAAHWTRGPYRVQNDLRPTPFSPGRRRLVTSNGCPQPISLTFCIPFWLSNGASLSPRLTRLIWHGRWGSKDGFIRVFWMIKWIFHPVCFYPKLEIQHSLHDFCPLLYPSSATHTYTNCDF